MRLRSRLLQLATASAALASPSAAQPAAASPIAYPVANKSSQVDDYHGTSIADPYRWLEDTDSPETRAWVAAENTVTFAYLETIAARARIRARLTEVWNYPKYGTPFKDGGRLFWFENTGLQSQSVLYVRDPKHATSRVLLDPNTLSADGTVALQSTDVTPNGRLLAYGVSVSGSDWQEFRVRDVNTGRDLPDTIKWVKFSTMSWTRDGKGFYYSRYAEPKADSAMLALNKNQKLYYHRVGTKQSADRLIYERPDQPDWGFEAEVTDDGQYAVLSISESTDPRNRLYVMDLSIPSRPVVTAPPVKVFDRYDASYTYAGNLGSTFYFRTTKDAPRGRVIALDLNAPQERHWRVVVGEQKESLESVSMVGDQLVARYLSDAHSRLRLFSLGGAASGEIALPGLGSVTALSGRPRDDELFYTYTSYLYPPTVFRHDLKSGTTVEYKTPKLEADLSPYETKQLFFTSKDGTKVPMFVTAKKGVALDGTNPTLLYGYGGFDISLTPSFSPATIVWLEMGGVYAVPNLRGGGEYGDDWHRAGTLERKQNVFDDFIGAAEFLIKEKYTSPSKLAIQGESNGGLLVGAAMTQRPELFAVALPAVGVMDMLRFHKFTIGWAWTSDYGSADDPAQFKYLRAYSPLHNLKLGTRYPATLVTTADHDDRVVPGHSFKFAAALQAAQAGNAPTLIRIETKAGHGAGKPTAKRIDEAADIFAFVAKNLGMVWAGSGTPEPVKSATPAPER